MNSIRKKGYTKPMLISEAFEPSNYIASCFTYKANLVCEYGQWHKNHHTVNPDATIPSNGCCGDEDGMHHGAACAESTVTVTVRNGVTTLEGTEGANKTTVKLESVNIPGVDQVSYVGQDFNNCYWESAGNYKHKGDGEVTYFSRQANAS